MSRKHSRSISTSARRPLDVRFYDRYKHQDTGLTWMWHHITWFLGITGSVWILRLLIITFLRQCALVSEEETTKLENPRIYRVEQHLIILTMKALIIFILIVVIQCLTGKFNMDMSFRICVENIHPTLYFGITELFGGEHYYEETEDHKTHRFRYSKVVKHLFR